MNKVLLFHIVVHMLFVVLFYMVYILNNAIFVLKTVKLNKNSSLSVLVWCWCLRVLFFKIGFE